MTLFLKTQKKFICIFWWSKNWEPPNPKKVYLNSWFEDIPIERKKIFYCFRYLRGGDRIRSQIGQKKWRHYPFLSPKNLQEVWIYSPKNKKNHLFLCPDGVCFEAQCILGPKSFKAGDEITHPVCPWKPPSLLIKFLFSSLLKAIWLLTLATRCLMSSQQKSLF